MDAAVPHDLRPPWAPAGPARPAAGIAGLRGAPRLTLHRLALPAWPLADLRIAVVADPHVCRPWLPLARLAAIVDQVNGLGADLILIAGDILADRFMPARAEPARVIVPHLARLKAPLGVHAAMGNHDWKDCAESRRTAGRENSVIAAFAAAGIRLARNASVRLDHGAGAFWLVTGDSLCPDPAGTPRFDPAAAFAAVPPGAPAILLAHEPDGFAEGTPALVQISGHTHGGHFVLFGRRPMTPSRHGDRYALGHIEEDGRHLIVSAGLGYTGLPLRLGVPPEITLVEVRPAQG